MEILENLMILEVLETMVKTLVKTWSLFCAKNGGRGDKRHQQEMRVNVTDELTMIETGLQNSENDSRSLCHSSKEVDDGVTEFSMSITASSISRKVSNVLLKWSANVNTN